MAQTVANHLAGSLCAIRIQMPNDDKVALFPAFAPELARVCDRIELASINETLAVAPIEKLTNAADWAASLETMANLRHRYYRAVPVVHDSHRVGIIVSLLCEDCSDSQSQQQLLES